MAGSGWRHSGPRPIGGELLGAGDGGGDNPLLVQQLQHDHGEVGRKLRLAGGNRRGARRNRCVFGIGPRGFRGNRDSRCLRLAKRPRNIRDDDTERHNDVLTEARCQKINQIRADTGILNLPAGLSKVSPRFSLTIPTVSAPVYEQSTWLDLARARLPDALKTSIPVDLLAARRAHGEGKLKERRRSNGYRHGQVV